MDFKNVIIFASLVKFIITAEKKVGNEHYSELNVKQLIPHYGYPIETHQVVTEDGYILELHRIPYGISNVHSDHKPAVLIVSGFLCSSADWVNLGPNRSLGLILADNGYDVWLCNNRGTTWSKRHVNFDPIKDSNDFWNFSFQEIASYDLPASIDYILSTTNQKKLHYIGHSQGTISYFAMISEKPYYKDKIRLMIGLAPGDNIKFARFPYELLYTFLEGYQKALKNKVLYYEILPHSGSLVNIGQLLCADKLPLKKVCAIGYFIVGGYSPNQLNKAQLPLIMKNFPSGASNKQLRHLIQTRSGGLRKYNYGKLTNRKIYGQEIPPSYNLSDVTTPVALYYADKDALLSYKRGQYLTKRLPNVVASKFISNFAHLDFMWGRDAVTLVYNDVLAVMKMY